MRQVTTGYGAEEEVKNVSGSLAGVSLTYDAAYRLTGLANAANKASAFKYDLGANLFQHTWPGGKHVSMTRDAQGNAASLTNARGTTATLTYSGDHTRVAGVTYSGTDHSVDVTYTYDVFGRLSQMKNATAQLDYAYDDLDNVTDTLTTYLDGLNRPIPLGGPAAVPPSQQMSLIWPQGGCFPSQHSWGHPTNDPNDPAHPFPNRNGMPLFDPLFPNGYDKFDWFQDGRIHDVTHHVNDVTFHNSADYDEDGHLTKDNTCYIETTFGQGDACTLASMTNDTTMPNDPNLLFCPRNNGPLPSVLPTGAGGPFSYSKMLRDPLGHLLSMEATAGDAGSDEFHVTITYGYDDQNHNSVMQNRDRLLGEQYAGEHKVFFLDPNGHPQHTVTPFGYINGYTPDAADNLTQVRSNVNNPATYTFNEDNQITNAGFAYDEDGNMTHTPVAALQYDAANHLTAYGANQLTFGYRPDGLRAWKQNGGNRTYYFYDGTRLLYEMTLQTNADASATDWQIAQYYGWGVNGLRQV